MLGIAAVTLTRHSLADAISDAKADRKNDQKGNRCFQACASTSPRAVRTAL